MTDSDARPTEPRQPDPGDEMLTADVIAAELGVSAWSVRAWCRQRKIASTRVGRLIRVRRRDLDAYLAARSQAADPAGV